MTTLISVKTKTALFLASDSQIIRGNLKLPVRYNKISLAGDNILIGGAGSLASIQQLKTMALKNIYMEKALSSDFDFTLKVRDFAQELANINFALPLEFKHYNSSSYIVCGNEDGKNKIFSIGFEGSLIECKKEKFLAEGSGMEFALSALKSKYREDMTDSEAVQMIREVFVAVDDLEVFTNSDIDIMGINNKGQLLDIEFQDEHGNSFKLGEAEIEREEEEEEAKEETKEELKGETE
jgi:proteasome beta subunit